MTYSEIVCIPTYLKCKIEFLYFYLLGGLVNNFYLTLFWGNILIAWEWKILKYLFINLQRFMGIWSVCVVWSAILTLQKLTLRTTRRWQDQSWFDCGHWIVRITCRLLCAATWHNRNNLPLVSHNKDTLFNNNRASVALERAPPPLSYEICESLRINPLLNTKYPIYGTVRRRFKVLFSLCLTRNNSMFAAEQRVENWMRTPKRLLWYGISLHLLFLSHCCI